MYCKKCGVKNNNKARFCIKCGAVTLSKVQSKLKSIYYWTGNISILFGIIGFVSGMVVGFDPERIVGDVVGALFFNFPRMYFGYKLKYYGLNDLRYALKISGGMTIYSISVVVLNLVLDTSGLFYIIPAFFYYLSYKETKVALNSP